MEKHKTVIVGAGPGGLRCAKILAENDEKFIVLERKLKFDRKICTGLWGLTDKTCYMGLPNKLFGKKFNKILISTPYRKIEVKLEKPFVATLDRKKLSEWMYKEAKKSGANIAFNSSVSKIEKNYVISNGKKIFFDYLIGADGSCSIVRKSLGLSQNIGMAIQYWFKRESKKIEVHYDADRFGPWYIWVVPHKGITSIGTGGGPKIMPIKKMKDNLIKWCAENEYDISDAKFEAAPICYDYKGYSFNNKFLIGDAAGLPSGLTGEGIYFAMASGEDVAKIIINNNHKPILINKILDIKKKHELILKTFMLNKTLEKVEYNLLLSLLKFKFFDKMVIDLVA